MTPKTDETRDALETLRQAVHNISYPYRSAEWSPSLSHLVPKGRIEALEKALDDFLNAFEESRV